METPSLDRLATEGTTFTHCYAAGASCVPSRASLFTGYYPHTVGITRNGDLWRHTWVEKLAQSGYHCVNIGKMHTEPMDTPAGFHERYVVENKERYLPVPGINRNYFDEWDRALAAHGLTKPNRDDYGKLPDYLERLGAYYLANITMIDQKIGEILSALREQGYLDNAVVVFNSDHGDCLGDHGLNQKC
jgi:arylsulfatase A-like enzyme